MNHSNIDRTVDHRMFGKDWWLQPLQARYASIDAHKAGLLVQVEMMKRSQQRDAAPCITWRGTSAQFSATKAFPKGVAAKRASGRWVYPNQLRGTVYPDGEDRFVFVIEYCVTYATRHYVASCARRACSDDSYLQFRAAILDNGSQYDAGPGATTDEEGGAQ
jgi:hypothetical protein